LENPVEIFDDIVVPDAKHTITEGAQRAVALPVVGAFRVLAAVELDYQAPLTTNEVDVVAIDRLLTDKFEAAEAATANACPQRQFYRSQSAPQ
jgi:hypothetical protein